MDNKFKLSSYFPLGYDYKSEIGWTIGGYVISLLYSFGFLIKLSTYENETKSTMLDRGMTAQEAAPLNTFDLELYFEQILGGSLQLYYVFAIGSLGLIIYRYMFHHIDSKSIYTMKRLPDKNDLRKRCVNASVIYFIIFITTAIILKHFYYIHYVLTVIDFYAPNHYWRIWGGI